MAERHIVAMGGGGFSMEPRNPKLDNFVLSLVRRKRRPRVCFVGTASGDSDWYIRRFHEAFPPSRAAATHLTFFERNVRDLKSFVMEQDVIYVGGGSSANMLAVWRLHGFDKALRAAWNAGVVMAGISAGAICWFEDGVTDSYGMPFRALDDGAAAHFAGTRLKGVVSSRPKARAMRAALKRGLVVETTIPVRYLGAG